jgi:hypothetical protein
MSPVRAASFIEGDPSSIRRPCSPSHGRIRLRELTQSRTIGSDDINLSGLRRCKTTLGARRLRTCTRSVSIRRKGDPLTVGRPRWPIVPGRMLCQIAKTFGLQVQYPDVRRAATTGSEQNPLAIRREGRIRVSRAKFSTSTCPFRPSASAINTALLSGTNWRRLRCSRHLLLEPARI